MSYLSQRIEYPDYLSDEHRAHIRDDKLAWIGKQIMDIALEYPIAIRANTEIMKGWHSDIEEIRIEVRAITCIDDGVITKDYKNMRWYELSLSALEVVWQRIKRIFKR